MSTYERDRLDVNGDVVNLRDAGSVRFDRAQSLTAAQQAQARDNIGAGTGTGGVTGVKGDAENDYRTGQVNLTPANIGLGNVDNTSDMNKPISTVQQAALDDKADASDIATIEQKIDSASAYGEVGPVPVADISDALPLDTAKLVIDIEPVQSGSGDPSPDNIRPISGWTGANVTRDGANLLDPIKVQNGAISGVTGQPYTDNRRLYTDYIRINGKTFTASNSAGMQTAIAYYNKNKVFIGSYVWGDTPDTRTPPSDAEYAILIYRLSTDVNIAPSDLTNPQCEIGSTATAYEPYTGTTILISWQSSVGTVYGGTLDVVNGVLTVDRGNIASYAGETLPGAWISSMDVYTVGGTPTTGAQVVYDLATPITYQLTSQQVALLKGDNTVFADCGDTTVGYWRDDSLSINKAITERAQLTFDTLPTEGSGNPVTSDGIWKALDDISDSITDIGDEITDINTELEKVVHVDSVQSFTDQEKFNARLSIGAVSIDEVEHKRFGVSGVGQSSPTLTRLYDAVGMTATPSTDVTAGSSDFDSFAPFNRRKCVGNWTAGTNKAVFTVNAYEGDADYAEDGSMGDYVAVEVEPFYYYDQDGILAVSTYPWPGYRIHPVCVDYDGNIRVRTYLPVYALAQDANGKAVSLPGFQNQYGGYKDLRDYAKTYNNNDAKAYAMIEPAAVWHYEWMLQTIEFATQDMQSVMRGAAGMRYNTNDKITAAPSANKIVVGSFGSDFVVGQTILINAAYDASVDVSNYNCITAIEKCDASGTPSSSGSYYLITYDGTDRSSGITANTTKVATRPWKTGATAGYASGVNAILGHTGCPVHLTNGKYPMCYRWRENVYGNQFMTTLDLADVLISDGGDAYHLEWYFLADPRKYMAYDNYDKSVVSDTSKGWVKLGVTTSAASYVNGYIKELGADPDYPYVRVPVLTTGGSSSTYYCDYAYLVNAAEVRAVRRGGTTFLGTHDGPCFFSANTGVLSAYWYIGAALYFLQ